MKKLEAIIRKSKFRAVKNALIDSGYNSFNYRLTRCISRKSERKDHGGGSYDSKASKRVLLSIYARDKDADKIIDIIRNSGQTNEADDSYLAIFNAQQSFKLIGGDNKDKLIEVM
jgi:nitrogen regulatory protein P-II 1